MNDLPAEVLSHNLLDKLILLNYEERFCYPKEFPLINRLYFSLPAPNRSEQYYYFASLSVWLLRLCGVDAAQPFQSDDPGNTAKNLLNYSREARLNLDIDIAKLRQGFGDGPCLLLSTLADAAIERANIALDRPVVYPEEVAGDDVSDDNEEESEIEENFAMEQDSIKVLTETTANISNQILEWKSEFERALPRLNITFSDSHDWSTRFSHLSCLLSKCTSLKTSLVPVLSRHSSDVAKILGKISMREKFLQEQLSHLIGDYANARAELEAVQKQLAEATGLKAEKMNKLSEIGRELNSIKEKTDQRGSQISNTEPLVLLRKDKSSLVKSTDALALKLAVTEQTLLRLREKNLETVMS
ncbi:hypothetical protein RCL1_003765 [Eukaryota sp. TZLM3-RCL]